MRDMLVAFHQYGSIEDIGFYGVVDLIVFDYGVPVEVLGRLKLTGDMEKVKLCNSSFTAGL